jgi:hypothetical protein
MPEYKVSAQELDNVRDRLSTLRERLEKYLHGKRLERVSSELEEVMLLLASMAGKVENNASEDPEDDQN